MQTPERTPIVNQDSADRTSQILKSGDPTRRFAPPVMAIMVSPFAVAATTWIVFFLESLIAHGAQIRPFGIAFIVPVTLLTLWGGWRAGVVTLILSALSLDAFLFTSLLSVHISPTHDYSELWLLCITGSLVIYSVYSARRAEEFRGIATVAQDRLRESERQREAFNREVLLAVTSGRLLLCNEDELAKLPQGDEVLDWTIETTDDARILRHKLRDLVAGSSMEQARVDDLLLATTEAATNAVKHANGATTKGWQNERCVTVLIADHGVGIKPSDLARATLEQGYSTRSTLGMGFTLMLQSVDLMAMTTSPHGTSILLQVCNNRLPTAEESVLARYDRG